MAFDLGAAKTIELEHTALALVGLVFHAEAPLIPGCGEVLALLRVSGFTGVASADPAPDFSVHVEIQFAEGPLGCSVAIIISPTLQ